MLFSIFLVAGATTFAITNNTPNNLSPQSNSFHIGLKSSLFGTYSSTHISRPNKWLYLSRLSALLQRLDPSEV